MTRNEQKAYQAELLKLAASVGDELDQETRELRRDEVPTAAGAMLSTEDRTDAGATEVEVGLITSHQRLLAEVVAALDRIDRGEFGDCQACGRKIAKARLDVLPYARTCVRCARTLKPVAG